MADKHMRRAKVKMIGNAKYLQDCGETRTATILLMGM